MPYIHKKSFEITLTVGTTSVGYDVDSDYFHADELIALPVQALNRKGYITARCCAGHPFDILHTYTKFSEPFIIETPCESYIDFKKEYSFPELPSGFAVEQTETGTPESVVDFSTGTFTMKPAPVGTRIIKKYHKDGDYWKTMCDIFESMDQLYQWTLNLPDFKD